LFHCLRANGWKESRHGTRVVFKTGNKRLVLDGDPPVSRLMVPDVWLDDGTWCIVLIGLDWPTCRRIGGIDGFAAHPVLGRLFYLAEWSDDAQWWDLMPLVALGLGAPAEIPPIECKHAIAITTDACCVCMDANINAIFLECGHVCCCIGCARHANECPVCRKPISRVLQLFIGGVS